MKILGLGVFADSSSAIVCDGSILCAVEEERLNRLKHYDGMPWLSVNECLNIAGLKPSDISSVSIGWNPYRGWINRIGKSLLSVKFGLGDLKSKTLRGSGYVTRCREIFRLKNRLNNEFGFFLKSKNVNYVPHHLSHAASAYFTSPYKECNIIVADGVGESETVSFFYAGKNKIRKLNSIYYPNSLGHLYASVTGFLGFKMTCDEGKVMALASYGQDEYKSFFRKLIYFNKDKGKIIYDSGILDYHLALNSVFKKKLVNLVGIQPRKKDELLSPKHMNFATSLQKRVEELIFELMEFHFKDTRNLPLCSAGGLFLNSVLNGKILNNFSDKYYIFPACGDNGVSVGAALYTDSIVNPEFKRSVLQNASLGKMHFVDIIKLQKIEKTNYYQSDSVFEDTINLINSGYIVGWYNGRMEYGPRALGNRSILASPLIDGIKDKVNLKVKHRENFRPFACAVLEEDLNEYFINADISPFMLKVFNFKDKYKNLFPSINHVDNSCRVQSVNRSNNEVLYNLLIKMKEKTGHGIILNTSMNDAGEPIVNTPQQALNLLLNTDLDYMVMDNYIFNKL